MHCTRASSQHTLPPNKKGGIVSPRELFSLLPDRQSVGVSAPGVCAAVRPATLAVVGAVQRAARDVVMRLTAEYVSGLCSVLVLCAGS
jgi:hypothetical protein